ncbi:MAG: molybdate ABC transporter substrate-binding protein [Ilumatobacter sp.]|nr:MAG: molybdate ABC transporter substrate-binding protein [Ilumatobacter sp.]
MLRLLGRSVAPLLVAGSLLASCGGDVGSTGEVGSGEVIVFATASLTEPFTELGEAFEREFDGVSVRLNSAASSELVTQINEGAPADVFASADLVNMDRLSGGIGTLDDPRVFATNLLQIIVEVGNPLGIAGLDDLVDPDVLFVTAAPEVPIGRYTLEVFENAGIEVTPRSLEQSVRGVVSKVVLGEADAGIVYATDVLAAGTDADGVEIPLDVNVVVSYPIAVPADASNVVTAEAFVDFVVSDVGQEILASYGFSAP